MKGNASCRIVLILVCLPLVLCACQFQLPLEPEATTISPSATPSPIPTTDTPEPTSAPTDTSTPTPEYPEQAGNIVETEMHEGRLFGIDDSGLATVVLNEATQEWEMYERPVVIAWPENINDYLRSEVENIDWGPIMEEMREHRLRDSQGNVVPFGYLSYRYEVPYGDGMAKAAYFTGYVIKHSVRVISGAKLNTLAFAIPLRYDTQIIFSTWNEHDSESEYKRVYLIPDGILQGSINEKPENLIPSPDSNMEIGDRLTTELIGHQIVFSAIVEYPWGDPHARFSDDISALIENMMYGSTSVMLEGISLHTLELWLPDSQE